MAMDLVYNIDCKHCGSHSEYTTWLDRRSAQHGDEEFALHIDTECAIRCPICRAKLNTTPAAFRSQVTILRVG